MELGNHRTCSEEVASQRLIFVLQSKQHFLPVDHILLWFGCIEEVPGCIELAECCSWDCIAQDSIRWEFDQPNLCRRRVVDRRDVCDEQ
jgi:hypothetical protein